MLEMLHHSLTLAQAEGRSTLLWGIILGAVALAILAIELVIPSGGLLAVAAMACVVLSIVLCFMHSTLAGIVALGVYLILGPIVGVFIFKWWLNSPWSKNFVLKVAVDGEKFGDTEPGDESEGEAPPPKREDRRAVLRALIGEEGEAVTLLRPVGAVRIHGERIDALAEGGSIPAGARVVVTDVYDNQVKVREVL